MSSDVVIRVRGLCKSFRRYRGEGERLRAMLFATGKGEDRWVLRDVSFDVRKGEALGVIGRNGAGKSTLLKIISKTLNASAGTAEVVGRVATLLELGAGLHQDYTGRENARFSATIMGLSKREFEAVVDDIERFAELGEFFDRRISEYSSGMYARLAFSINIHCRPDILIVDEILSVGDIAFQMKCLDFLRSFCAHGRNSCCSSRTTMPPCARSATGPVWIERGRAGSCRSGPTGCSGATTRPPGSGNPGSRASRFTMMRSMPTNR